MGEQNIAYLDNEEVRLVVLILVFVLRLALNSQRSLFEVVSALLLINQIHIYFFCMCTCF